MPTDPRASRLRTVDADRLAAMDAAEATLPHAAGGAVVKIVTGRRAVWWARTRSVPGDVVLDLDRIIDAMTSEIDAQNYAFPSEALLDVARVAFAAALARLDTLPAPARVWVVHRDPTEDERREYQERGFHVTTPI